MIGMLLFIAGMSGECVATYTRRAGGGCTLATSASCARPGSSPLALGVLPSDSCERALVVDAERPVRVGERLFAVSTSRRLVPVRAYYFSDERNVLSVTPDGDTFGDGKLARGGPLLRCAETTCVVVGVLAWRRRLTAGPYLPVAGDYIVGTTLRRLGRTDAR